jgi:hypothetical protein
VRIPSPLHAYWDCLFIHHALRKVLRHFVRDPERALREGEATCALFPRMIELACAAELPVADIEYWRDFCHLLRLARRYYFLPFDPALAERIRASTKADKKAWPGATRERYRIKLSFEPFKVKRRTPGWISALFLRRQRGYRLIDHILTLNLRSLVFRLFRPGRSKVCRSSCASRRWAWRPCSGEAGAKYGVFRSQPADQARSATKRVWVIFLAWG